MYNDSGTVNHGLMDWWCGPLTRANDDNVVPNDGFPPFLPLCGLHSYHAKLPLSLTEGKKKKITHFPFHILNQRNLLQFFMHMFISINRAKSCFNKCPTYSHGFNVGFS